MANKTPINATSPTSLFQNAAGTAPPPVAVSPGGPGPQTLFNAAAGNAPPPGAPIPANQAPPPPNSGSPLPMNAGVDDPKTNEPLSKELYTNSPPWSAGLLHGYMRTPPSFVGAPGNQVGAPPGVFYCFFLFNPIEIQQAYGFDQSVLPTSTYAGGDLGSNTIAGFSGANAALQATQASATFQNQTYTFTLVFDRTYEVNAFMQVIGGTHDPHKFQQGFPPPTYTTQAEGPGPGRDGVMWDVRALERLMGMYDAVVTNTGTSTSGNPQLPPIANPVDVYFGCPPLVQPFGLTTVPFPLTPQPIPPSPEPLAFRGFFTSFEVTLERFAFNMVPTHCSVQITMAKIYRPDVEADLVTPRATTIDVAGNIVAGTVLGSQPQNALLPPGSDFGGGID